MRIILTLVVAWIVAGCQETSGDPTVVQFWAMGREGEVVRQLIPDFERAHPDVRVEVQQLPWSAAHQKLLTAFAGDALPDVAQLGNTWLPEFAALHALEPVEPSVVDSSDYFPGIWQTNVIDQTAYGVPWYVDTRLLFYRKDLLAEAGYADPPTTWAEWIEMLRAIKQGAGLHRYGALLPLNEYEPLLALALQQEAPLLRDGDSRGNFRSEDFKRALRFYREMFDNGFAPATNANQISNVWDEFARGSFTFYIT
jgi:multiple sugar transport system substrate-binding protein